MKNKLFIFICLTCVIIFNSCGSNKKTENLNSKNTENRWQDKEVTTSQKTNEGINTNNKTDVNKNAVSTQTTNTNNKNEKNTMPYPSFYAPDFTLEDLSGKKISLSMYNGHKVVLIFWATWCGYCLKELPALQHTYENYKDKIYLLLIDIMEEKEKVLKYVSEHNIKLPILLDISGEASKVFQVNGTPSHFFINADGKIFSAKPGFMTNEEFIQFIDNLVKG